MDELAAALREALRKAPLERKERTDEEQTELWVELGQLIEDKIGKAAVIRLLGITGTSDDVRSLALRVLEGQLGPGDTGDFARANVKQRSQVILPAVEVLGGIPGAEAVFALAKVYAHRDDEAGSIARKLAENNREKDPASNVLEVVVDGEQPTTAGGELDSRELLLAAMAMPPQPQSDLSRTSSGKELVERMEPATRAEGERIRKLSSGSGGLHSYDSTLRDEMINLVLVAAMPVDEEFHGWARENLFRREDLEKVRDLAPFLPGPEISEYAKRALSSQNRRGPRSDRAKLALELLRESTADVRSERREEAVACLDEEDADLRAAALRLVSVDSEVLPAQLRGRLATVFDELPPAHQSRISADLRLGGKGPEGHESFLRWVRGAEEQDVRNRLEALLERWAAQMGTISPEQAAELIQGFGGGFALLGPDEQSELTRDLVAVTSDWIRSQKGRIVESTSALTRWEHFRDIVATHVGEFIDRVRVDQAKGLIREILGLREGSPDPDLLAKLAEQPVPGEEFERVMRPIFVEAVRTDQQAISGIIEPASTEAGYRLLTAGLIVDIESKVRSRQLAESLRVGTPEALLERQRIVLDALEDARDEADGNQRIVELLGEIGRTIGGDQGNHSDQGPAARSTDEAGPSQGDPPEAVLDWRKSIAERFAGVVEFDGQILVYPVDSTTDGSELLAVIKELDRRSNSKRIAPVSERKHYREDLVRLLDSMLDSGLVATDQAGNNLTLSSQLGESGREIAELLDGGRPELRDLFWQRASERSGAEDGPNQLITAIERSASQPDDSSALSMLSAALESADSENAEGTARSIAPEMIGNAWIAVSSLISIDLRSEEDLRTREREKEAKIGREMGSDFELRFEAIERLLSSYFRFRERLAESGWRRIEDRLGRTYRRDKLKPTEYEIRNDDGGELFVVKTMGIKFDGQIVSRAIVEPVEEVQSGNESPGRTDEGGLDE